MRIYRTSSSYFGNCKTIFNPSTGKSVDPHFVDVSDFAVKDENAIEIDEGEFFLFVDGIPPAIEQVIKGHELKYLFYDGNVWVIYDVDEDTHYFFG